MITMKQAGISSDAVKLKTGKEWDEWFAVLDAAGALALPHKEIAALLHEKHAVPSWWAQMVTVGYEQARGLRQANQQGSGFTANISRTLPFPAALIFEAFADSRRRQLWLDLDLKITTSTPDKSVRIAAAGRTRVDVNIYSKDAKTTVQLQHEKLSSAEDVQRWKAYWAGAFDRLKAVLSA